MKLKSLWFLLAYSLVISACDDSDDGNNSGNDMVGAETAGTAMEGTAMTGTKTADT